MPGSFDGLHHMPGPDRSFLQEYRLNSKPHIRRILQHQQREADAQQPQPVQAAAESSQASAPQQQAQAAGAEASSLCISEHDLAPSWPPAGPCQQADRPDERAQAVAEPHQAAGTQNGSAGSWRPVTASQMLKRQRVTAPFQQQLQQQPPTLQTSDDTPDAAGCECPPLHVQPQQKQQLKQQQEQQQQRLGGGACKEAQHVQHDSALKQGFQDEAADSCAIWQDWDHLGCTGEQLEGMEESCSDAGQGFGDEDCKPGQEFAWAEPPPGFGEGSGEEVHAAKSGSEQTVAVRAPRTWPCQVCTFAGNRAQVLRCAMCNAVRGTSWEYYQSSVADRSALATPSMSTDSGPKGELKVCRKASASQGEAVPSSACL